MKFALFYLLKKNSNNESNENSNWEIKVNILLIKRKKYCNKNLNDFFTKKSVKIWQKKRKFDTIQVASNVIQYYHSNGTYFHNFFSFFHYFIVIGNMQ